MDASGLKLVINGGFETRLTTAGRSDCSADH